MTASQSQIKEWTNHPAEAQWGAINRALETKPQPKENPRLKPGYRR